MNYHTEKTGWHVLIRNERQEPRWVPCSPLDAALAVLHRRKVRLF